MLHYDENDKCERCGKKLESQMINYTYTHDMGIYDDSYRKVNRDSAKVVGLGFYCNDCYNEIGESAIGKITDRAKEFLSEDLNDAINDVTEHYKQKMEQLTEIKEYVENCIYFLENKNKLSDLSKEEAECLLKTNHIYQPNYQTIKVGFCSFKQASEVRELYNQML